MPGFTTHTYICYQALRSLASGDSFPPFAKIAQSHELELVHAKGDKPVDLFNDAAAALAGCAYIGACGPDLFYIEYDKEGDFIADLLHYNRTGPFIVRWLTDLRMSSRTLRAGLRPRLERQLAYCLGHISHIAADITIHPYVNSIVGAYPENQPVFKNARGFLPVKKWKFHNILEHYQDAYILHDRFIGEEGFGGHPDCTNLGGPAGTYLRSQTDRSEWLGFVARTKAFYRYTTNLDIEKYKYDFFANQNTFVNVSGYYSDVIPDKAMMSRVPTLTQGKVDGVDGLFDQYVAAAVALTLSMWAEVRAYLDIDTSVVPTYFGSGLNHRLASAELAAFPILGKHWNLDCGLAPVVKAGGRGEPVASPPRTGLSVGGGIELATAASVSRGDFKVS